jgi:endoglucanase
MRTFTALIMMLVTHATVVPDAPAIPAPPRRPPSEAVKVCQVGYLPGEAKFAMLTAGPAPGDVLVRRWSDGAAVLTVKVAAPAHDADSGDTVRALDFSELSEPGSYYLDVPGVGASLEFRVGADAFARPFRLAMRSYTGQRCGMAVSLAPDFPQYRHDACHLDDAKFHASSGRSGTLRCPGGWHDAGDYGRYTVNAGITTGTLLWAYELNARKLRALNLDVPESGGALPDMLAEIKWNLDWMLGMQDPADGGAWHKATTARFAGHVMPDADRAPMLVIGSGHAPYKTAQATADLAAVAAIAARVYRPFDPGYADRCLAVAERAFGWAAAHPEAHFAKNPPDVHTGAYADNDARDELLWASAELFRTTGMETYNAYFTAHYAAWSPPLRGDAPQGWPAVQNMAMFAYAMSGGVAAADAKALGAIRRAAVDAADDIVARASRNGYRVPLKDKDYHWGSNAVAANYAVMLLMANRISPKSAYVNCAQDTLHYLLGRNTFNTSFVTHVGARCATHPHHRPSIADGVEGPWPGLLVGGPNAEGKSPPARQWMDDENDYARNETAINWNAPLVLLLAEALPAPPEPGAEDKVHGVPARVAP